MTLVPQSAHDSGWLRGARKGWLSRCSSQCCLIKNKNENDMSSKIETGFKQTLVQSRTQALYCSVAYGHLKNRAYSDEENVSSHVTCNI